MNGRIVLALLAVYVIWGSTYLAIRVAVASLPPFMMASTRFLVAGVILYAFLRMRGDASPSLAQWGRAAWVGTLLLVVGNGLVVYAEQRVPSGLTAIELATMPLWAALFAGWWGSWPTGREWLGLALGLLGMILLGLGGELRGNPVHALALVLAAAGWALGTVWGRHLDLPSGLMTSAMEMTAGGVILLGISLLLGESLPGQYSFSSLAALAYLIVFGSLVAFSAYNYLVPRVSATLATSNAYANPVVAVLLGVGLAGERMDWLSLSAMLVILAGVALIASGQRGQSSS